MKAFIGVLGFLLLVVAALATPVAIAIGLYDWVIAEQEFKFALWYGFKAWLWMIGLGLGLGYPCFIIGSMK